MDNLSVNLILKLIVYVRTNADGGINKTYNILIYLLSGIKRRVARWHKWSTRNGKEMRSHYARQKHVAITKTTALIMNRL